MKNKILLLLFFFLMLASCSQESALLPQGVDNTKEVMVRVKMKLNDMVTGLPVSITNSTTKSTRSVSAINENRINDVWVLQYDATTKRLLTAKNYASSNFDDFSLTLSTSPNCNIYFVANVGASADGFSISTPANETDFLALSKSYTLESELLAAKTTSVVGIPMVGSLLGQKIEATTFSSFSVPLKRLLARVDLTYSVDAALTGFVLSSLRICNVPATMGYYPTGTVYPTASFRNLPFESSITASATPVTKTYYLPVNMQGSDANLDLTNKIGAGFPNATYFELVAANATVGRIYKYYVGSDAGDYNIEADKYYQVAATIKGTSRTDKRVTNFPESNCYIVAPGGTVYIPVSRAVTGYARAGGTGFSAGDAITTGVLWSDVSATHVTSSVMSGNNYIKVVATNTEGNSVVYAKSGSTIVWSWHIWVTNYNPDATANTGTNTATYLNNSILWMDRNLGATTATPGAVTTKGFVYQWGRKDPFPSSKTLNTTEEPTLFGEKTSVTLLEAPTVNGNNLLKSINNPITFYFYNPGFSDWYTQTRENQNDQLWNDGTSAKTIYDPCPVGWCVPIFIGSISPWTGISQSSFANIGITWGVGGSFYPAAGYRGFHDGKISTVGTNGAYWSRSANGSIAYAMSFNSGNIYEKGTSDYRAYGYSVRCVQE